MQSFDRILRVVKHMISIIGLTGGIGCGKSTVARQFAAMGASVIDADQVARDVVAVGTDGLAEIVARFGASFLDAHGALDRKKMADHVFAHPDERRALESIVIPRIGAESMRRFSALEEAGSRWAVYEATLLVEQKTYKMFQSLLVVTANSAVQLQRVMHRDKLTIEAATARVEAQLPLAKKVELAEFVIDNSSTEARLHDRCLEVFALIVARYGASRVAVSSAGVAQ